MRFFMIPVFLLSLPTLAQDVGIQRELILRQQQSEAFSLQLRQSQELSKVPPNKRGEAEVRQLADRQRLENVSQQQIREVRPETPPNLRAYERHKAEEERRALLAPPSP